MFSLIGGQNSLLMHVALFPDNLGYNVYWDDCVTKRGGGALLAVSKRLNCEGTTGS